MSNPIVLVDLDGRSADWFKNSNGQVIWDDQQGGSLEKFGSSWSSIGNTLEIQIGSYIADVDDIPVAMNVSRSKIAGYVAITGTYDSNGQFGGFKSFTSLSYGASGMFDLPEGIGSLNLLECLGLQFNQLTDLPDTIGAMTQLCTLNLRHNPLHRLPETMARMSSLEMLDLSVNLQLEWDQVGPVLESMGSLKVLILTECDISVIPNFFGGLTQLTTLDLRANPIPKADVEALRAQLHGVEVQSD